MFNDHIEISEDYLCNDEADFYSVAHQLAEDPFDKRMKWQCQSCISGVVSLEDDT
jgi:hypothetical protein